MLHNTGIQAWAVLGLLVLIIAALANPKRFSKVAPLIGTAATVVFFTLIGRKSEILPEVGDQRTNQS
ncbi:MAG TPA: hypothetical protein VN368_02675 [Candidatus Methylomirabilis sp.]|nr:hypothetical protein [Candidatus Methylomirabilis sp.]